MAKSNNVVLQDLEVHTQEGLQLPPLHPRRARNCAGVELPTMAKQKCAAVARPLQEGRTYLA